MKYWIFIVTAIHTHLQLQHHPLEHIQEVSHDYVKLYETYLPVCFTCIVRHFQVENNQLIEKIIKYKAKDADRMNEENDNFLKWV